MQQSLVAPLIIVSYQGSWFVGMALRKDSQQFRDVDGVTDDVKNGRTKHGSLPCLLVPPYAVVISTLATTAIDSVSGTTKRLRPNQKQEKTALASLLAADC
jgi:hypothetical protein